MSDSQFHIVRPVIVKFWCWLLLFREAETLQCCLWQAKVFTSAAQSVRWSDSNKTLTEILSVNSFDPNVEWKQYVFVGIWFYTFFVSMCYPMRQERYFDNLHNLCLSLLHAFSALTLLVGHQSIRPVKIDWWGVGVVVCLEWGACAPADATASQNPIIAFLISIHTGFTFLVPAYPGCPGKEAVKRV